MNNGTEHRKLKGRRGVEEKWRIESE
jgi:hypothetical protein